MSSGIQAASLASRSTKGSENMDIKGMITAMVTPFDEQGKIDEQATKQLVGRLIAAKVDGLFILGTNGEFHVMNREEKRSFAEIVIQEVSGRIPVYAGAGGNSTKEVIELGKELEKSGADALSILPPYFVAVTEEELYQHYSAIADAVNIPILLYNIPKNTGTCISAGLAARLAKIENIKGIKDSSGDLEQIKEYVRLTADKQFSVLAGSDSLILEALEAGAAGAVAATSNTLTKIDVGIYQNWLKGDLETAQRLQNSIEEFRRILKLGTIPSVLKKTVELIGIPVGAARRPVADLSKEQLAEIERVINHYQEEFGEL